ncbi:MAG: hypothetical protein CL918_01800 [Deltaproteobacteria bacterium]|nr:hypothetical protein [Deltaproteobacteria bacterium]|tara:strand:- start:3673 stop:3858 length:186 start_codon:yes stop_codon:yes gene_type:complete
MLNKIFNKSLDLSKKEGISLLTAIDNLLSTVDDLNTKEIEEYLQLQNKIRKHHGFPPFGKK